MCVCVCVCVCVSARAHTHLALLKADLVPISKRIYRDAKFLFIIPLQKSLLHHPVGPLSGKMFWLSGVVQVSTMDQTFQ